MILFEVCLDFILGRPGQVELLRCVLERLGVGKGEIAELEENSRKRLSFFTDSGKRARFLKRKILGLKLKGVCVSIVSLKTKDWQTRWKEDFKPFSLTPNIRVVPAWMRGGRKKHQAKQLFIDTDTVFGTGMHPTTRFMAGFIESKQGLFDSFLDVGTGTGILSLAAWMCGVHRIGCVDISNESVLAAKRNFKRNKCFPEFLKAVDFSAFHAETKFDFVAANLHTDDLIKMRKKLMECARREKYLAVSGISIENYGRFRRKFDGKGLRCLRAIKKDGWAAVLYIVVGKT
jgi:ribosomal protein L11 methyltransferase